MTGSPQVSVILPCRNEVQHIEPCLRSILAQKSPVGGFEVVVADGMSTDGTRDVLATVAHSDPRLRVVDNPARFTPQGLNIAIEAACGQIIVRMDAHTGYAPDYITQCVTTLLETGADNVGGPWVAQGSGFVSAAIASAFQSPFAVGGARGHRQHFEGPVDTVYLGCWPRTTFAKFGPFDEELVRNQDDEHNLRILRGGGKLWQSPTIKSWYTPRGSIKGLFRQYYQYGYWKVRVIQKHRCPASVRHLVPGLFLAGLLVCAIGTPFLGLFRWTGLVAVACYAAAVLVASILAAAKTQWRLAPVLPVVFATYHFGYGLGFLHGALDFVVLRRTPGKNATALTRADGGEQASGKDLG